MLYLHPYGQNSLKRYNFYNYNSAYRFIMREIQENSEKQ